MCVWGEAPRGFNTACRRQASVLRGILLDVLSLEAEKAEGIVDWGQTAKTLFHPGALSITAAFPMRTQHFFLSLFETARKVGRDSFHPLREVGSYTYQGNSLPLALMSLVQGRSHQRYAG